MLFTHEIEPQIYKLFTMALREAIKLHWCPKTSSVTVLPQADGQHRIPEKRILQAMVDEETIHGTHLTASRRPIAFESTTLHC